MKKIVMVGFMVASAVGCARMPSELDGIDTDRDSSVRREPRQLFSGNGFVSALGGRMDGSIGPAVGLAGNAEYIEFMDDGFSTSAYLTVRGEQGSGMGIIYMAGSVQALEVGEGVRTCQDDYMDPDSAVNTGGVSASFTGCANTGAPEDGWSYDQPADCTDVEIVEAGEEAPPEVVATMNVLAHWGADTGGGQERTVKATLQLTE